MQSNLTQARLKEVLALNEQTGELVWLVNSGANARVGRVAGWVTRKGYLRVGIDGREYMAHRLVWLYVHGAFPAEQTDHINGNRKDNRPCNLREASGAMNSQNLRAAKSNNKCGLLGVTAAGKKFCALIRPKHKGKYLRIGPFATKEEAHAAYVDAKRKFHAANTL